MDGGVERETRGRASIHGEWCIFFGFRELMKRRKSSVKMTRGLRGEGGGEMLERNMQNKLGQERKAARGVAKRGRGGEGERGS